MKITFSVLILFLATILQITLVPHLSIFGVYPDFVFVLIIFFSILKPIHQSLIFALVGGLFLDFFTLYPLGAITLSFILISYLFSFVVQNILKSHNLATFIILGFIGTIIYEILVSSFIKLADFIYSSSKILEFRYNFIYFILPEAVYNTILIFLIFLFFQCFKQRLLAYK